MYESLSSAQSVNLLQYTANGGSDINTIPKVEENDDFGLAIMSNGDASSAFPSLDPKNRRNFVKRQRRDKTAPIHQLATNSSILAQSLPKNRGGRPKKPVPDDPEQRRSVGRPRIHPIKEVDPNRPKRGSSCA
jgi:hypothetical protein